MPGELLDLISFLSVRIWIFVVDFNGVVDLVAEVSPYLSKAPF